jgi:hypothetical protein
MEGAAARLCCCWGLIETSSGDKHEIALLDRLWHGRTKRQNRPRPAKELPLRLSLGHYSDSK